MNYKQLILFITAFSAFILLAFINIQTTNIDNELQATIVSEDEHEALTSTEKEPVEVDGSTLELGFGKEERSETEAQKKKRRREEERRKKREEKKYNR